MTSHLLSLKKLLKLALAIILIYLASNVNLPFGFLMFFAFVPIFLLDSLFLQFFFSFAYFFINFYWFGYYWPMIFNVMLYVYLALFWLIFWLVFKYLKYRKSGFVLVPLSFVIIEYLRSLGPLGFISGTPAYAIWHLKPLFFLIKAGKIWLVDFVIILVNYLVFLKLRGRSIKLTGVLLGAVLLLSFLLRPENKSFYDLNVIVINTCLTPERKWQKEFSENIEKWYLKMLEKEMADKREQKIDFIVFPETAVAKYLLKDRKTLQFYKDLAVRYGAVVIIGTKDYQQIGPKTYEFYNTGVAIYPDGRVFKHYKLHPVPFAERQILPKLSFLSKAGVFEEKGQKYTVFPHVSYPFSILICYETTYPDILARYKRAGTNLFFNISNEGALSKSRVASLQLVRETMFRALETNTLIIKSANRGFSVVFYPDGEYNILGEGNNDKATFVHIKYPAD